MRKIPAPLPYPPLLFQHGGNPPAGDGPPLLDFSAAIHPLGPPPAVPEAVRRALPAIARYPDPDCRRLTRRLAEHHEVDPDQVIVGNGSNDLIHLIARACRPRGAAVVEPTYTEYLRASLLAGATVDHWLPEGDSFQPVPIDPGNVSLVWLCNPNNPTGRTWPAGVLAPWIEAHPHTRFVVDEAFLPFLPDEADHSLASAARALPNLVVLRSLTKIHALPGLRVGYALLGPGQAALFRAHQVPWSVNALAQAAALAALEDDGGHLARTHAWLRSELDYLTGELNRLMEDLEVIPSRAPFLLLRLRGEMTAGRFTRLLAARGLAVRDASNFVGLDSRYIRVGLRAPADNRRLVEAIRGVFGRPRIGRSQLPGDGSE